MIFSRSLRIIDHTGIGKRFRLYLGSSEEYWTMRVILIQLNQLCDEGFLS